MLAKIKQYQIRVVGYLERLRDVKNIGMLVFVVIVLLVSWSGVKAINMNYQLQRQITALQQQNSLRTLSNDNLKLQNEYYDTPQYLELAAREDFGLASPGETVLIVPQSVALAHTVTLPQDKQVMVAAAKAKEPFFERDFHAWMDFFLHRQNTDNSH